MLLEKVIRGEKCEGPVHEDRAFFDFKISVAQIAVILCKLSGGNFGYERTMGEGNGRAEIAESEESAVSVKAKAGVLRSS
jgi:hypothetical protein